MKVVFRLFRAEAEAPVMVCSTLLAVSASGGVLRKAATRMIGYADCILVVPEPTAAIALSR